ncbi:glycoside hydrolase family 97 protein [Bacteroides sp. 51]|uniref:glycoside hydrolase family 97 protein n=1 Tax=Bacteroides sp. 51 TaxID=2302938 RepID=UPI0013D5655C|nr:glycoside hydrolase family 97 protein [Bacteroides sp. 51]NDV84211.1 glycoside hydrolase family 97 protein [Bacteroides sp. 51]
MKQTLLILLITCLGSLPPVSAQKQHKAASPDGRITATVTLGDKLTYTIAHDGETILHESPISLTLSSGEVWGDKPQLAQSAQKNIRQTIASPFYRKEKIDDEYTLLTLNFKKQWGVEFRVYNDGLAYRFVSKRAKPFTIAGEEVAYNFGDDVTATVPYVMYGDDGNYESQFHTSFENTYTTEKLSRLNKERLMFLPLVAETASGKKICISESDLESYPGMFMSSAHPHGDLATAPCRLTGIFAAYPRTSKLGGHNMLQFEVTEREPYMAKVNGPRTFPWRMAIVTTADKDLADSDMTYKLAAPSRIADISWIKPGKVAWDWWNDWNITGVDFVAGINNDTYKYYIDFAAANGIEYVILDEGWAVNLKADLMQVVDEIDIKELVDYGAARNVDIILWAGYHAFNRDMENVCRHYSELGVKGFKVDFMDRDDQEMVEFNYRAAETCARYKMILDLHGMYKPAGLNRTYPNVLNFEGVHGLEQMKWSSAEVDQMKYDVTIPFIRQVAGPIDYTQGAMRNGSRGNYHPSNSQPMSQGTRCHQLAGYVVFESPFNMLCDSPTNYMREPESLEFIASIPTVWDETITLDGKIGEYIVTARRKGNTWYIGGMTNWDARDLQVDLSFLGEKARTATLFRDGANAHRNGTDYKKESIQLKGNKELDVHLAPGGGFALRVQL